MADKPLSVADIDQLRRLLKLAAKSAPLTREQRDARRWAQRVAYKAAVLAYCQQYWDERYAALKEMHPACYPEMALGERPTVYASSLRHMYERRNNRLDSII